MRKRMILCLLLLLFTLPLSALEQSLVAEKVTAVAPLFPVQNAQFEALRSDLAAPPKENYNAWDVLFNTEKENHIYAMAVYLYNRYILQNEFGINEADKLSLNSLGALDAFMRLAVPFEGKNAPSVYQKNQKQIQGHLAILFSLTGRTYPQDTAREKQEISRLKNAFHPSDQRQKPFYVIPETLSLTGEYTYEDIAFLTPAIRLAKTLADHQVILFKKTEASLQDFDTLLARGGGRNKPQYTFRWVKDECEYSSYILGKQLLQTADGAPEKWGKTRLYKITARSAGYYLRPAQGERFTLSDGSTAAKWQYHTALLVILQTKRGDFIPLVLDNFLGNALTPFTLAQWLTHFDKTTQFEVVPFAKNKAFDEAIQTPEEILDGGKKISVNHAYYDPAPIEE